MPNFNKRFTDVLTLSRSVKRAHWTPTDRSVKLGEEFGEFSEAVLHKRGLLPHKTMKEPIEGEAADIVICTLDTLASVYPELTPEEVINMLNEQLKLKVHKWHSIQEAYKEVINEL